LRRVFASTRGGFFFSSWPAASRASLEGIGPHHNGSRNPRTKNSMAAMNNAE
jgi:hypothetical protein